jgi:hypothetical protein
MIPIDLSFARCRRTERTWPVPVLVRVGRVADLACTGVPGPHATGLFLTTRLVATDDAGRQFRGGPIVTHGAEGRWPLTRRAAHGLRRTSRSNMSWRMGETVLGGGTFRGHGRAPGELT